MQWGSPTAEATHQRHGTATVIARLPALTCCLDKVRSMMDAPTLQTRAGREGKNEALGAQARSLAKKGCMSGWHPPDPYRELLQNMQAAAERLARRIKHAGLRTMETW